MKIKTELLKRYVNDYIKSHIEDFEINADRIADSTAIKMLSEIQIILKNYNNCDFDTVEQIVCVFEKYNIDFGNCHDF